MALAGLLIAAGTPATADPLPLPSLPPLPLPTLPSLPPLPLPTASPPAPHPHTTPPTAPHTPPLPGLPALPGVPALPGLPGIPGLPGAGQSPGTSPTPAGPPGAGATSPADGPVDLGGAMPPEQVAAIIAGDPGADLYPQPAVDPVTGAQSRLVARLNDLQHRIQYLQNVLARTRADLSVAQAQLDAPAMLITLLTAPATLPARSGGSQDRVSALMAAIVSGEADLLRSQSAVQSLQQQVDSGVRMTLASSTQLPTAATTYGGGRLRRPVPGRVTSSFGNRFDPYYHVWQLHAGVDLGAASGTAIVAAASGRVTRAGWDGGYGNYTCIDHGQFDGQRLSTCYGHQSLILVRPGQAVSAGQVIGRVGATGAATGPHLHFEVRLGGRPVDPLPWIM